MNDLDLIFAENTQTSVKKAAGLRSIALSHLFRSYITILRKQRQALYVQVSAM